MNKVNGWYLVQPVNKCGGELYVLHSSHIVDLTYIRLIDGPFGTVGEAGDAAESMYKRIAEGFIERAREMHGGQGVRIPRIVRQEDSD